MKEIIIRVDESAYECVLGMLKLCQKVEVVGEADCVVTESNNDVCVAKAIRELQANKVFRHAYDYTWIMIAFEQNVVEGMVGFKSPQAFLDYMVELGIEGLPTRVTLSNTYSKTYGDYPDWRFENTQDLHEILRRKNVVKQFLSAFNRAKKG